MEVKCNQYKMDDEISIYEFERKDEYEYYIDIGGTMLYSFGWYKKNDPPRFTEEDLTNLFENGYFDQQINDANRFEWFLESEFEELLQAEGEEL